MTWWSCSAAVAGHLEDLCSQTWQRYIGVWAATASITDV